MSLRGNVLKRVRPSIRPTPVHSRASANRRLRDGLTACCHQVALSSALSVLPLKAQLVWSGPRAAAPRGRANVGWTLAGPAENPSAEKPQALHLQSRRSQPFQPRFL